MVRVLRTTHAKRQIDSIYNDYDLAYIGERFSESFKEWNYHFYHNMHPILSGTFTSITTRGALIYAYRECTITYIPFIIGGDIIAIVIQNYNFNQKELDRVREETKNERARLGMRSNTATTTVSRMNVNDYIDYHKGGMLYGDEVIIVKKKGINRNKRQLFNYKICPEMGTPFIMYNQDFYSAFPFQGNIAHAWGTDGHKYELGASGRMRIVENKKSIDCIITETITNYFKKNLFVAN